MHARSINDLNKGRGQLFDAYMCMITCIAIPAAHDHLKMALPAWRTRYRDFDYFIVPGAEPWASIVSCPASLLHAEKSLVKCVFNFGSIRT